MPALPSSSTLPWPRQARARALAPASDNQPPTSPGTIKREARPASAITTLMAQPPPLLEAGA
eukprot:7098484-Pyramimonas_sp.AAC.1